MKTQIFLLTICFLSVSSKSKSTNKTADVANIKKILEEHEQALTKINKLKDPPVKITNYSKAKITPGRAPEKAEPPPEIISPSLLKSWAQEISDDLIELETKVVRKDELLKGFKDAKMEFRDGSAIVMKAAKRLEEVLLKRVHAAEQIMKKAEEIATPKEQPPSDYEFDSSYALDETKQTWESQFREADNIGESLPNCTSIQRMKLLPSKHFDTSISLEKTSVHTAAEVFPCDTRVLPHLAWSEGLLSTFQKNYAQDSTIDYQYFCSAKGFLRHYPASPWSSNFKLEFDPENDVYDCRLRPWYVSSQGAPRDILILLDASGSMNNSALQLVAEQFTLALLSALTDDDQVNVLRFNVKAVSPITCFNNTLWPADHVNSAAIIAALKGYKVNNLTLMSEIMETAVRLLQRERNPGDRPASCQQAIVLLTDSMEQNFTEVMRYLDPRGRIRLFILWLHEKYGVRDNTRAFADHLSCDRDGYFAEFISPADVTEQVIQVLRILERPLVAQRKHRPSVFSDLYAHVEDPRRAEQQWQTKEQREQKYRYLKLRKNKEQLLSPEQRYKDFMYQENLDKLGIYHEGEDVKYRMQISVSVPVFESTTIENITIELEEEKKRKSTRTYPVNRLLGVAGVDITIDQLKLLLPYHQIGGGGSLFIIDHRGNIVLHDNIKPVFDGDILKPGYRTVDFIDLEQAAIDHRPRHFPKDWLNLRKSMIIDTEKGNMTMYGKNVFEGGMRINAEMREYHWQRVLDHYTVVVVLPQTYSRHHVVPETSFTKEMAEQALKALSSTEYAVQPDWLYCRHIEPHFDNREAEVLHFIRRRSDEPNFLMENIKYEFSPIPPTLLEKTYQCDEGLMAKLCKEAIATEKWAREHEEPNMDTERDCSACKLGSSTAFFASESGLTRWQQYHATTQHAPPPSGAVWSYGPTETWYRRAAARPNTLVIHAPVAPVRKLRASFEHPPSLGVKQEWLTAARTLSSGEGLIGVTGYHFYPQHLIDLLASVTEVLCYAEDKSTCKPRCEGAWACVLIDEGGWVVARNTTKPSSIDGVREHLATLHPAAMAALSKAGVFQLNWIHDYQAVCFTAWPNAAAIIPSILRSLWHAVKVVFRITQHFTSLLAFTSTAAVAEETYKDKLKRRNRLLRDTARDKYDNLFDPGVLVNKSTFAACDRTRPFYHLQHSQKTSDALSKAPTQAQLEDCSWPLVAAFVPDTNLILLAIYKCDGPYLGQPLPDPTINMQYIEDLHPLQNDSDDYPASRLACWRNSVPLPNRLPKTACYPHNYPDEVGYRQCGPWVPDEDTATILPFSKSLLCVMVLVTSLI